jgi:RimJ/RimL family protein N-acetyltransferase
MERNSAETAPAGPPEPTVHLLAATPAHLSALRHDRQALADLLGSPVPDGWPQFPEATEFTLERLSLEPGERDWWMYFFLSDDVLVGSGGYVGPPEDGAVEIGYELAPAFRGRGLGRAAARALVERAFRSPDVDTVVAHTLAGENPSGRVLARLGFTVRAELVSPEDGPVRRWGLDRAVWDGSRG